MDKTYIDSKLEKYIATRDRRMKHPISSTPLLDQFKELQARGTVEVGGRSSCGSGVDPTWLLFTAWGEIVRKAQSLGYGIAISPVKHVNKSPTMAGGFWNSNVYQLISIPGSFSANGNTTHPAVPAPVARQAPQRSLEHFDAGTQDM